jgi:D-psicose/D-tagatose/L-ribulose 3-epimerase
VRRVGVIVGPDRVAAAESENPDYLEPAITGSLVHRGDDGHWTLDPVFAGRRHPSFALLFPGDLVLSDPRVALDPVWAYLDEVLPLIASVAEPGARIVFGSGTARRIPDDVDAAAGAARFAETLRGVRDRAAAHDLVVMLEPLNTGETNLIHTIVEAIAYLDEHGIDGVPVVADLFHIMAASEPLAVVGEHIDRIGHVHLADGGRRFIGAGGYPWRELLDVLDAAGYARGHTLECNWGDDFTGELRTSLALVREHGAG